jgi:hypothetical protein
LSRHVAETLNDADFDVMVFTAQPTDRNLGHAFTFPRYRLAAGTGAGMAFVSWT